MSQPAPVPMSRLDTFAVWRAAYPTWPEFKAWLQEVETSIEILEFEGNPYVILKCNKDDSPPATTETAEAAEAATDEKYVPGSYPHAAQLFRSVVWDTRTNTPSCVAPFAARTDQKVPMGAPLRLEDFVEGVMINVFRSASDNSQTHVTTRSRLDADGTFYSDRTFSELFEEAMDTKKISLNTIENVMGEPYMSLRESGWGKVSSVFMSLVLAHPEHRVVRSVDKANFWAIYRGVVYEGGMVEFFTDDLPASWRPKSYGEFTPSEWSELKAKFDEIKASKPWYWQGLVVYEASLHEPAPRWRFRNGNHDRVRRELRGTESNPFGRFLRLRANKRVQEYLRIYPEDSDAFNGFERDYRAVTKTLYSWYCACHKEHSIVFKALPKSVQPLVFGLHKTYLETLRPAGKSLHMAEVINWITEHLKSQYGVPNVIRLSKCEGADYAAWVASEVQQQRRGPDGKIAPVTEAEKAQPALTEQWVADQAAAGLWGGATPTLEQCGGAATVTVSVDPTHSPHPEPAD